MTSLLISCTYFMIRNNSSKEARNIKTSFGFREVDSTYTPPAIPNLSMVSWRLPDCSPHVLWRIWDPYLMQSGRFIWSGEKAASSPMSKRLEAHRAHRVHQELGRPSPVSTMHITTWSTKISASAMTVCHADVTVLLLCLSKSLDSKLWGFKRRQERNSQSENLRQVMESKSDNKLNRCCV